MNRVRPREVERLKVSMRLCVRAQWNKYDVEQKGDGEEFVKVGRTSM